MSVTSTKSSFQKKLQPKVISIPGTKPSIHNSQLLTSTGIASFDFILGGGLPVGSILLIEEDAYDVYNKIFLKFYLAEGLNNGQFVYLASLNDDPRKIFDNLPGLRDAGHQDTIEQTEEKLEIAWRYQDQKSSDNSFKADNIKSNYDLMKTMDISQYTNSISTWTSDFSLDKEINNSLLWSLLVNIENKIKNLDLLPNPSKLQSNVMRIAIHSLLSPLWFYRCQDIQQRREITKFFTILKAIIRSSFSVAVITVPSHLLADSSLVSTIHGIVDFGIRLESFQGSVKETNPLYKDYHGLLHINKLPAINTMIPNPVDLSDWAFQLNRKTLSIKRLHLPPDLSETVSRTQENGGISCSSGSSKLDF